jgi:hypothetical protein
MIMVNNLKYSSCGRICLSNHPDVTKLICGRLYAVSICEYAVAYSKMRTLRQEYAAAYEVVFFFFSDLVFYFIFGRVIRGCIYFVSLC